MRKGFTLVELLVVVGIIGILVSIIVPNLQQANELAHRTVCMSNLSGIGKGLIVYRNDYDSRWPWLAGGGSRWDTLPTGANYTAAPEPNATVERSVTALMFLLVRERQPVKLFTCPSDKDVEPDRDTFGNADANGEAPLHWDFTSSRNVSYSWQAPIAIGGGYANGVDGEQTETAVMADKTPKAGKDAWTPVDVSTLKGSDVRPQNSQNHAAGKKINVLFAGMNVVQDDRPDIGVKKDNIYTASGLARPSQKATSLSLSDHLSSTDTFLIGPVPKP